MKILFLIPNLSHGGAEKVLVNLVNNMDRAKYDITVMTIFDVGVNKQFLNSGIRYKYIFKKMPRGNIHMMKILSPKNWYRLYIKEKYDVAVSYLEGPTARMISGCANDTKLVSWIHVEQQNRKIACKAFRNYKEANECYKRFDKTICVSEAVKKDFLMLFPDIKNVSVLFNTIESDYIREKSKEEITDTRFTEYSGPKLIGVGKISERKGFMRLARIHMRLLRKGYDHRCYILGVGSDQRRIENYLRENKLLDSFIFLGYDENPYKYIVNSDIFVCASLSEGFSTAVTEALILGTPVVTTRCAGMEELLGQNNEYGIITVNDEQALEKGIENMLSDKKVMEHYAKEALERGKMFETDSTVAKVQKMFDELMQQ